MAGAAQAVQRTDEPLDRQDLSKPVELFQAKLTSTLSGLEEVAAVESLPNGNMAQALLFSGAAMMATVRP
jgi:hypothetical protein